jgi:hypothetical protein
MGPAEDDADSFIISKLGTGEVVAWLLKNGDVYLKEKVIVVMEGQLMSTLLLWFSNRLSR